MSDDGVRLTAVATAVLLPLLYALVRSRRITRADYIYNSDDTGLAQTVAGIICGNIGAGTFVALLLFTGASPVIGLSLALAYVVGVVLCGVIAPRVHAVSRRHGVHGLIDLIVVTHGIRNPLFVWVPIAFLFLLRTAIQLLALAAILTAVIGLSPGWAILAATVFAGSYTAIGGYRIATETDVFQAALILAGLGALAVGSAGQPVDVSNFFDLGPYRLPLLIGIWIFIPASAVLAIDNWQRMATARSPSVARRGFFLAAPVCCAAYLLLVVVAMQLESSGDVLAVMRGIAPASVAWLVDLMLIAAIMSTIDTFVMPLATSLERSRFELPQLRVVIFGGFCLLALVSVIGGELLQGLIAAFSSLMVCLPATFIAMTIGRGAPSAAIVSLNLGIVATLVFIAIDINLASLVGFAFSAVVYALAARWSAFDAATMPSKR
ncbi:sodium:solute symporter family transporter [Amorphus orientalis]|uniref:Na+/proline symporter n=1 Tax=Amorphus orientalis TaxID=649198 RepID=A0AAE3VN30_9HYPH|nr:hypothetical protein [Amorphus orientalis]MDQ0314691.1 Na+/proline symporter [Amorphus orientalis]